MHNKDPPTPNRTNPHREKAIRCETHQPADNPDLTPLPKATNSCATKTHQLSLTAHRDLEGTSCATHHEAPESIRSLHESDQPPCAETHQPNDQLDVDSCHNTPGDHVRDPPSRHAATNHPE